jgi:hypothetical protein
MDIFVRIGVGKLQFASGGSIAGWRSRFRFNPRHVRFWIEGGRLVTAIRLVQTEIEIDQSVCKAVRLVARCPPAPANKTSEDELEECQGRKITMFIG